MGSGVFVNLESLEVCMIDHLAQRVDFFFWVNFFNELAHVNYLMKKKKKISTFIYDALYIG